MTLVSCSFGDENILNPTNNGSENGHYLFVSELKLIQAHFKYAKSCVHLK